MRKFYIYNPIDKRIYDLEELIDEGLVAHGELKIDWYSFDIFDDEVLPALSEETQYLDRVFTIINGVLIEDDYRNLLITVENDKIIDKGIHVPDAVLINLLEEVRT